MAAPPPAPLPPPPPIYPQNAHRMENGIYPEKSEAPTIVYIMKLLNTMTHFFIGAVAFSGFSYATAMRSNINIGSVIIAFPASYSTHIYLNVSGYIILMSEAMLVYSPFGGCVSSLQASNKRMVSMVLQITGSFLAIVGSILKMIDADANFYSAHSVIGFLALLLTGLTLIGGVLNFVCCQRSEVLTWKILHACLGAVTVTLAFMAMIAAVIIYFEEDVLSIMIYFITLIAFLISVTYQIFRKHL